MKITLASELKPIDWSGGSSTELYIYPKNASYKDRNFDFRISTASVEVEYSEFTPLSGVNRTLMLLDGRMRLQHENHHSALLHPLDKDVFKGDWITRSEGKCIDLNLMCRNDWSGNLFGYTLDAGSFLTLENGNYKSFIYLFQGEVLINDTLLSKGDLAEIEHEEELSIESKMQSTFVRIVVAQITDATL